MATRHLKSRVDWIFIGASGALVLAGTLAVLSAASPLPYYAQILERHFVALALGTFLFLFGLGFNYQVFQDQSKALYGLVLGLLILVLLFGTTLKGHRAWLRLPFLTFQPAELARVGVVLVVADFLDRRSRRAAQFWTVLLTFAVALPPILLILKQPDYSTVATFLPILCGMLFCAGADVGQLLALIGYALMAVGLPLLYTYCQIHYPRPAGGSLPALILQTSRVGLSSLVTMTGLGLLGFLAWRLSVMLRLQARPAVFIAVPLILGAGLMSGMFINHQLKGYQRNRFAAYVAPQADIQGASYHVHQSQIAIGSGGFWGKGLFSGTQSKLGFLPERHTDFAFAVVGEEMGFAGAMGILALYLALIWRIVVAARFARDRYGYLVCCGLATMFAFELALNVGMCVGLMPVAGIPLPLISYGGSSLVITMWSLGIVANVYLRRYSLL